ncbi:hypothetical protein [Streptomyces vietnamensis]
MPGSPPVARSYDRLAAGHHLAHADRDAAMAGQGKALDAVIRA